MKRSILTLLCLVCCTSALFAAGKKKNTSFHVGQIYVGGSLGVSFPASFGADKETAFNKVASTGFLVSLDAMRQMNQAIGLGIEGSFRNYGFNDDRDGLWAGHNRGHYGTFEAAYRQVDMGVNGRVFITKNSLRPFIGVSAGGALLINSLEFTPNSKVYDKIKQTDYKTTNLSAAFGIMTGAYYKLGLRTLISLQVRANFVPKLKDGKVTIVDSETFQETTIMQNVQGNQNNISATLGIHIGVKRNNKN